MYKKYCRNAFSQVANVLWNVVCVCLGRGGGEANAKREAHEAQILTCSRPDSQTRISLITPQDTT